MNLHLSSSLKKLGNWKTFILKLMFAFAIPSALFLSCAQADSGFKNWVNEFKKQL